MNNIFLKYFSAVKKYITTNE